MVVGETNAKDRVLVVLAHWHHPHVDAMLAQLSWQHSLEAAAAPLCCCSACSRSVPTGRSWANAGVPASGQASQHEQDRLQVLPVALLDCQ
jgi:hypothetical protein